jgi:hypothetical protein
MIAKIVPLSTTSRLHDPRHRALHVGDTALKEIEEPLSPLFDWSTLSIAKNINMV